MLIHGSATPTILKSTHDWDAFLDGYSDELRTNLHYRATPEEGSQAPPIRSQACSSQHSPPRTWQSRQPNISPIARRLHGRHIATCEACPLRRQCLRKPDITAVRQVAFFEGTVPSKLPNPHCRAMREKIDSPEGRAIYAHRMGLIEPVFGQQRGLRRFTLRSQSKVDTQWKLFAIVHNVAKLLLYGKLAA